MRPDEQAPDRFLGDASRALPRHRPAALTGGRLTCPSCRAGPISPAHVVGLVDSYFRDDGGTCPISGLQGLTGNMVPYDIGDGILTPPLNALIRVADYLKSLQAEQGEKYADPLAPGERGR